MILREFEGERNLAALSNQPAGASGDVKYHLGAEGRRKTAAGDITVISRGEPEPPRGRRPRRRGPGAKRADRPLDPRRRPRLASRAPDPDPRRRVVPGQGVVAETLNLQSLGGYSTGGTLHVIANNQVGFTTDPADGRSTRYSSDLAKGFDVPIIHVNADDPEAAVSSIRLALAFRRRFGRDVVIDLIGYRRWGHNEGDEPAYTQPLMAERIKQQPSVREQYAALLVEEGVVTQEEADGLAREVEASLKASHETLKAALAEAVEEQPPSERTPPTEGRRGRDRRRARTGSARSTRSSCASPIASPSTRSSSGSSRGAANGSREARSTGATARRSPSRACSSRAFPSGSPARTPSAGRSRSATSSSTIRGAASSSRR